MPNDSILNNHSNKLVTNQLKLAKREFPIRDLKECITKLHRNLTDEKTTASQQHIFSVEQSIKIQSRLKYLRCLELFEKLMPNSKGFINKNTIKNSTLEQWELDILKPLLNELEKFNEKLTFNDFLESISALFEYLPDSKIEEILKTTQIIHNRHHSTIYERGIEKLKKKEEALINKRIEICNKELSKCSFKPIFKRN